MTDRPTIHVTNWPSRTLHGPGAKLSIMTRPRAWEHGDGSVPAFAPHPSDLDAVRAGNIDLDEYRRRVVRQASTWASNPHPGIGGDVPFASPRALAFLNVDGRPVAVFPGDTLLCACSRDEAAAGRCHRTWIAGLLVNAGWHVVLDGRELAACNADTAWVPEFNDGWNP